MTGVDTMTSSTSFGHAMGPNGNPGQVQTQANSAGQPVINHITLKAKEEVIASLHLIKDIRRLETYQRDFFLKVKESLNHVQLLLDHQLMDMAWSDSLMNCEESLLKTSVHLGTSSASQLTDLYGHLLQDREKLSRRFQELSVKSSLSEYVVNSRHLLDIETVHHATEAILHNEKPLQPKGDKSIPVDHTFFLANFCTTSIASSMFATQMPKLRDSYQQLQQPHSDAQSARYVGNDTQAKTGANSAHNSETGGMRQNNPSGNYYANSTANNAHGAMSASNGLYNGEAMDKYNMADAGGEVSKAVFGTHDLVSAISQITRRDEASPTKKDPWTKGEGTVAAPPGLLMTGSNAAAASANAYKTGQNGTAPGNHEAVTTAASSQQQQQQPQALSQQQQNDGSSDSAISEPEEYDSSKPLSFARIASLNLEKQRQQMASANNGVNNVNATFVTAAAAAPPTRQANAAAAVAQNSLPKLPSSAMVAVDNGTASATMPLVQLPPSGNPRYFFEIVMEGKRLGRVIIEVQPAVAPKMAQNFGMLVTGEKGFGYKGCQFFQAWKNESVICGDWEHNSGRGGRSALDGPLFTPDETRLPCVRGAVGMRRMSKKHSSLNQVASQFRVILANMSSQFTGIFGHVVAGIEALDKVANMGGEGGRPEKVAVVTNCGVYKA